MNKELESLKQQFLEQWSLKRLYSMKLEEYTNLTKDSFCYWVEHGTRNLGSIAGGSSYKFGVYKRNDTSKTIDADNRKTDGAYAWFTKYGDTLEEAFEKVRSIIIEIATNAQNDTIEAIDTIDLGTAYKWKIAFLYGNNNVVNIFKEEALKFIAQSLKISYTNKTSIATFHRKILKLKPKDTNFYIYTEALWKLYKKQESFLDEKIEDIKNKINAFSGNKSFEGINDAEVAPQLHATIISQNFARLLVNLKDNKGQMLGLFGQWGRGKTFLMNLVRKELNESSSNESSFYNVDFHAWKYQDTYGVWAYLYQQIAEQYFTHKKDKYILTSKLKEYWLLFKLNRVRNGFGDVIIFIMLLILIMAISLLYPEFVNDLGFWNLLITSSASVQTMLFLKKAWKLGDKGKRLIKQYTHKPGFNKLLGVQAEIQEELKYVLKAWISEKKGGKIDKRLLLFVDDLDRCKEERLIQVIDALRVMLEEDEIVKRVIIVTAIDEKILERAIEFKYRAFLTSEGLNRKGSLIKEYLDKLFIACIKLPPLYDEEKDIIIDTYASKLAIEVVEKESEIEATPPVVLDERKKVDQVKNEAKKEDLAQNNTRNIEEEQEQEQEEQRYTIRLEELNLLKEKAKKLKGEITPRQLRIFMYRYLLAKDLAKSFNNEVAPNQEWCAYVLDRIIDKRNKDLEKNTDHKEINEEVSELIEVSDQLEEATQKIIEIVAPY